MTASCKRSAGTPCSANQRLKCGSRARIAASSLCCKSRTCNSAWTKLPTRLAVSPAQSNTGQSSRCARGVAGTTGVAGVRSWSLGAQSTGRLAARPPLRRTCRMTQFETHAQRWAIALRASCPRGATRVPRHSVLILRPAPLCGQSSLSIAIAILHACMRRIRAAEPPNPTHPEIDGAGIQIADPSLRRPPFARPSPCRRARCARIDTGAAIDLDYAERTYPAPAAPPYRIQDPSPYGWS